MLISPLWPGLSSACSVGSSGYFPYPQAPYLSVLAVTQECILSWALHHTYRDNVLLFQSSPWCAHGRVNLSSPVATAAGRRKALLQVFFFRGR